jgi:hypothetical protein
MFPWPSQKHPLAHSTQPPSNSGLLQVTAYNGPSTGVQSNGQLELWPSVITHTYTHTHTHTHTHTVLRMKLVTLEELACTLLCVMTNKLQAMRPWKSASSSTRPWNCFPSNSVQGWWVVNTAYHPIRTESSSPGIKQPGRESEHWPPSSAGVNNRWIYVSTRTCVWTGRFLINPLNTELNPICHLLASLGAHHILHVSRIRVKHNEDLYLYPLPSIIYCRLQTDSPACHSFKPYRKGETADRSKMLF